MEQYFPEQGLLAVAVTCPFGRLGDPTGSSSEVIMHKIKDIG